MSLKNSLDRRTFLAAASGLGAAYALSGYLPLPLVAGSLAPAVPPQDPRLGATPILDKGFASSRKIGEAIYATISDTTKGFQTLCNGGCIIGKDAALVIEGYASPAGAAFQMESLRLVSQAPVRAAIDTHYHFDHSFGNAHYGANGIPIWAHAKVAALMVERYSSIQGKDKAAILEPVQKRIKDAATDTEREHAKGDLGAMQLLFQLVDHTVLSLPSRSLLPAELPLKVDLGGIEAVIETHPGHTPGDIIVRVLAQNITFAGDLFFHRSYPVTFDADMLGWRATLEKFAGFGKDALFVPGHGAVSGQEGIASIRSVFDDLAEYAKKMAAQGVSVSEAQQRYVVPEKFKSFGIFSWGFCMDQAVAQFYDAARKGKI